MLSARTLPVIASALALVFAGCSTAPPPPPTSTAPEIQPEPAPPPPPPVATTSEPRPEMQPAPRPRSQPPPSPPPGPAPLEPGAEAVVTRLASQLRIPAEQIEVSEVSRAEWPDSCLGLPADGEICSSVITPGYAVSLRVGDQRYEFRASESGERIRVASAPQVEMGEPLLNWRDSQSFTTLIFGRDRTAYGLRGRPLLGLPPPPPLRVEQLMDFVNEFAAFQARTPAGEVNFRGRGTGTATAAEQRMIAEWAAHVAPEVERGLSTPTPDEVLVWQRTGAIAGACDRIVVGRTGFASAWSCGEGEETMIATTTLEPGELEALYQWLDRFESFSWSSEDRQGRTDGFNFSLDFFSAGLNPVGDVERQQILAVMEGLASRLLTADGVVPTGDQN